MTKSFYTPPSKAPEERAYLVGVTLPGLMREDEEENLAELELLAKTAGARVAGRLIQNRTRVDGSTYIGDGKIGELAEHVYHHDVNLVIFDDDLSPAQARNIEKRLGVNVIDRTELILDIFVRRARTRQAKIQVEIAQLTYAIPRLKRLWDHLSRQAGGIGTRGPGETQLEVDRRKVRERVAHLKRELRLIDRRAGERRKRRGGLFNVTLVGYTNSGKSTLLNRLAGSHVKAGGRLFTTLDSTTRRVEGPDGRTFLLTDTVGFIRKLPAHLVASFRATLQDVMEADLLLHLVDSCSSRYEEHISVVNLVLERACSEGAHRTGGDIPEILILNKVDLIRDEGVKAALGMKHPEAVLISAAGGEGVDTLAEKMRSFFDSDCIEAEVRVPHDDGRAIALVEERAWVLKRKVENGFMTFNVRVRKRDVASMEKSGAVKLKPLGNGGTDPG